MMSLSFFPFPSAAEPSGKRHEMCLLVFMLLQRRPSPKNRAQVSCQFFFAIKTEEKCRGACLYNGIQSVNYLFLFSLFSWDVGTNGSTTVHPPQLYRRGCYVRPGREGHPCRRKNFSELGKQEKMNQMVLWPSRFPGAKVDIGLLLAKNPIEIGKRSREGGSLLCQCSPLNLLA